MKIELKDVIHLYIGQKAKVFQNDVEQPYRDNTITGIAYNRVGVLYVSINYSGVSTLYNDIKLILRPLSDITNDECIRLSKVQYEAKNDRNHLILGRGIVNEIMNDTWGGSHKTFMYFIENGFDIFGLIESNQAIDKTKSNENNLPR